MNWVFFFSPFHQVEQCSSHKNGYRDNGRRMTSETILFYLVLLLLYSFFIYSYDGYPIGLYERKHIVELFCYIAQYHDYHIKTLRIVPCLVLAILSHREDCLNNVLCVVTWAMRMHVPYRAWTWDLTKDWRRQRQRARKWVLAFF